MWETKKKGDKNQKVTKHINSNETEQKIKCDKTQKLKMWQNSKYDTTQKPKCERISKLKMWQWQ